MPILKFGSDPDIGNPVMQQRPAPPSTMTKMTKIALGIGAAVFIGLAIAGSLKKPDYKMRHDPDGGTY